MIALFILLGVGSLPADAIAAQQQALPVLEKHCFKCHGETKFRGGLSLVSKQALAKGGETGPAVNLKNPEQSILWKAIEYDGLEMPPAGKLPEKERGILRAWISAGAPLPEGKAIAKTEEHKKPSLEDAKTYWAYQPVKLVQVPQVAGKQPGNPVDAFLLAKLQAAGLGMNPRADKRALIRRVSYDLTGLPPTPEEVQTFLVDSAPDAYEKLVDRLLASPAYGERWGRHWLDVVRFAETNGYERDGPKPNAYRYRDYVIRSFNADKPFDRFVKEQIAGDEIDPDDPDSLMATGFYRLGTWDDEPADRLQATFDEFDDIVATTSQAFLGMTMNCARCHDHKIDPVPQTDYYRMLAFFRDIPRFSNDRNVMSSTSQRDVTPKEKRAAYEKELEERERQKEGLTKKDRGARGCDHQAHAGRGPARQRGAGPAPGGRETEEFLDRGGRQGGARPAPGARQDHPHAHPQPGAGPGCQPLRSPAACDPPVGPRESPRAGPGGEAWIPGGAGRR